MEQNVKNQLDELYTDEGNLKRWATEQHIYCESTITSLQEVGKRVVKTYMFWKIQRSLSRLLTHYRIDQSVDKDIGKMLTN